jgi:hypothetical protein
MTPYWLTVSKTESTSGPYLGFGIGVSARSEDDAREIAIATFGNAVLISKIELIRDFSVLDQNHVVPNIDPSWMTRGHLVPTRLS